MKGKKKIVTVRLPLDDYEEIENITFALHRMVPGMIRFMLWTWPKVMAEYCDLYGLEAAPRWMEGIAAQISNRRKGSLEKSKPNDEGLGKILAFPGSN